ncbi:putative bifunctional diguanylate cyclase/phosphodiesterase [Actinoplanes couchii]|uniref:putative bifunctional diguanylate cyclase/phosphodiesterase n=1 Tax=Actinoplanes couchii TaxID=403638 RepID=UPI001EF1C802|nr:bifunctional diguanylate cyclase/phosphodiesterase [Actinoplanes couchii]
MVRACFGVWTLVITSVYYAFPDAHLYSWAALGYSAALAVLAGVWMHKPRRKLPWVLISLGIACFTTGDSWYNLVLARGGQPGFPGLADFFYLAVYPLLTAGLLMLVRARNGGGANRAALLDALVPTVGLGLLAWVYWIAPFTRADHLSMIEKLVSIGYPLGDVLVLAVILRMFTGSGKNLGAVGPLGVALVGLLVSDVFYGQSQLSQAWNLGGPVDLGWVVFYSAMGFAALRPEMRELSEPVTGVDTGIDSQRLFWLSSAALTAPAVLALEYMQGREVEIERGGVVDAPVIAAAAATMFLMVLVRVADLARSQRQASSLERALREASAGLFAASTEREVFKAVEAGVARLMPPGQAFHLHLPEPVQAHGSVESAIRVIPTSQLPEGLRSGGYLNVLYATHALSGDRALRLAIGAPDRVLRLLTPAFEALGQQIVVVLERIALTAEVSRAEGEAWFRTLIQSAADVIFIVNPNGTIRYATPSAEPLFGTDPTGTELSSLIAESSHSALREVLARVRAGAGDMDDIELTAVRTGGRTVEIECDLRDLRADPTVAGLVMTLRDVTERRGLEKDLTHQAFHDALTGLANRVLFRDRLEQAFSVAQRDGATLGVLFVDLDDFKEVNDTLGHAVGDQLLLHVAERITEIIGAGSTAARMGGDEFAVLVEQSDSVDAAERVAAALVEALAGPVEVPDGTGGTHVVSARSSVGVATNRDAGNATELLRHADLALYLAKGNGKGGWQRYQSDLHTAMMQRLEMRTALYEAIEQEQFVLQFQPIVELIDQKITGVEALVRWQHPVRGLLGPYHFVEAAEESGAIVGIGNWVLREALRQFAQWKTEHLDTTLRYVSVNVSVRQFRAAGFADQVRDALAASGARPEWLLLEITESLVLKDADRVLAELKALREIGVRIAIDDFGTGYSSLSYLRQMPVDVLKLDKSFIDDILHSRQQHALVDAIVTLSHNLDLAVVAEGIEEAGQRAALDAMGCRYGQGYHFAKPLWPGDVPAMAEQYEPYPATDRDETRQTNGRVVRPISTGADGR